MNAVITGAGTGIGAAAAYHLAADGVSTALVGRRPELLEATAARIQQTGGMAAAFPADLSDADERTRLHRDINAALIGVDMLLHNAAQLSPGVLVNHDAMDIQTVIDTNLTAAIDLTRLFLPQIIERRGVVAFVLSNASVVPLPYMTLYSATKAGLQQFARALRHEVRRYDVRVLLIYPPDTLTPMTAPLRSRAPIAYPLADADAVGGWIARGLLARKRHLRTWGSDFWLRAAYHLAPALVNGMFHLNNRMFARIAGEPQ